MLQRKEPLQHAWQANIDALALAGCLNVERGIRITQLGRDLVDSLEPVLERLTELAREDSPLAARRLLYAAVTLGDLILSRQVAERAELEGALTANIARAAEQTEQRRATQLIELLQTNSTGDKSALLAALADLGTIDAKRTVARYLLRTPVDGVANTALAILLYWNGPDAVKSLEDLIELRHAQAFGVRSRLSAILGAGSRKDKLPRGYQVVRAVIGLLQRSRPGSLKPALRGKILTLLEASGTANSGEAALLQYTLDTERGLNGLRTALSGTIPAAQCDSAAACVLLHTRPAEQILIEALDNPHLEIQHTAACALQRFPTAEARESAAHWPDLFQRRIRANAPRSPPGQG